MVMTLPAVGKVLTPYDQLIQPDPILGRMYEFPEGDPVVSAQLIMEHCPELYYPLDPPARRFDKLVSKLTRDFEFVRRYNIGFMVLDGPIGAGKDVGLTWFASVMRMLWPTRPLLAEFFFTDRFRELFGNYQFITPQYLRDQALLVEALAAKMGEELSKEDVQDWLVEGKAGKEAIKLRNSIIMVNELRTWFWKRRSTSKTNELGQGLLATLRHSHMMWLGATQFVNELDPTGCQQKINYHVRCRPDAYFPDWFNYEIRKITGFNSTGWDATGSNTFLKVYGRDVFNLYVSDNPAEIMVKTRIDKPKPKKKDKKQLEDELLEDEYVEDVH
jgi:hypothetical protein